MTLHPPLKWAGGKRWLVPYLRSFWKSNQDLRLVEPLCGGLAVTLGLIPKNALLNDVNSHLVNFYQWLKKGLISNLDMVYDQTVYYRYRDEFNRLIKVGKGSSREAAELFYYLNRSGYNGLCRFNQKGEFNVPFGKYKTVHYEIDFSAYKEVFTPWEFSSGDFVICDTGKNDFIYADPPYDVEFTHYSKEKFGWDEQIRLAEWLAKHPGPVVLSNQATERIIELYEKLGFTLKFLQAPRMINCTGDRTPAREVLAMKGL